MHRLEKQHDQTYQSVVIDRVSRDYHHFDLSIVWRDLEGCLILSRTLLNSVILSPFVTFQGCYAP